MARMCPVCHERAAAIGVLCAECRDEIAAPPRAIPEQVRRHEAAASTDAALIDVWGRPHALGPSTPIGRSVDRHGLAVLEGSISRQHARIALEDGAWTVRDLGSVNGTYVDEQPVGGAVELHAGARVRFGQMTFYFLPAGAGFSSQDVESSTVLVPCVPAEGSGQIPVEPGPEEDGADGELPSISLKLHEPILGGGGFLELEGKQVQLTATQLELISLMVQRMTADSASPPPLRGFVRSSELLATLSWDSSEPNENHVKQLVRRVRRALMKVAHGDLIESRHRFGYRLRAIPRG